MEDWLAGHRQRVEAKGEDIELHPAVVDFQRLIASDPVVGMYVSRMIAQVPETRSYSKRHLENPDQMLRLINEVLTMAPEFGDQNVTLPLGAILDWTMGTPAGFAAFRDPKVNAALKKILTAWCDYLNSPESLYVLNDSPSGWTSDAARRAIGIEQYEHDPADPHWGFTSWNDFFTRRFRDGARPVAAPEDDDVIVAACESTPFSIRTDVKRRDEFWLKTQPYSLEDMLANDEAVEEFVGGTVYQAFLSATNYHRWHSPVAGTIVRAFARRGHLLLRGRLAGFRRDRTDALPGLPCARGRPGGLPHPGRQSRHRPGRFRAGRHVRGQLLSHPPEHRARTPCRQGRGARALPVRRLHPLPRLRTRSDRRLRDDRDPPTPRSRRPARARPLPPGDRRSLAGYQDCCRPINARMHGKFFVNPMTHRNLVIHPGRARELACDRLK